MKIYRKLWIIINQHQIMPAKEEDIENVNVEEHVEEEAVVNVNVASVAVVRSEEAEVASVAEI
tara:strand:+ start:476 stop:664 length:189 start_codon:yes stop_codon:yes gene_type:complete